MKNTTFYLALFTITMTACQFEKQSQDAEMTNQALAANISASEPGAIPPEEKIYRFIHQMDKYTWKDLDDYYRTEIPQADRASGANLKKMTIIYLVNYFGLLEKANIATIEFYMQEQLNMDLIEPVVFLKTLQRLKGEWPDERLKTTAEEKYKSAIAYANSSLKNPQTYLAKHQEDFDRLQAFIHEFPVRD